MSDTVGQMVIVTDLLPPTGAAKEPRRQITITDGQKNVTVTLWGESAQKIDSENLCTLSKREPVIIMFVGMMVNQYAGTLALKGTPSTRWHVNVEGPEMKAMLNRNQPYKIKVCNPGQAPREKVETTISALKRIDPLPLCYWMTHLLQKAARDQGGKINFHPLTVKRGVWPSSCSPLKLIKRNLRMRNPSNVVHLDIADPRTKRSTLWTWKILGLKKYRSSYCKYIRATFRLNFSPACVCFRLDISLNYLLSISLFCS